MLLGVVIYYPVSPYMLMDDGLSGLWEVRDMDWGDILRSDHFKSLYQVHYFFLYLYWHVFGTNSFYHFIWFIFLMSVNLALINKTLPRLLALFGIEKSSLLVLFMSILLLIAPNNFENIAWAATSHYNLGMMFYLIMLNAFLRFVQGSRKWIYGFYISFFLGLLTIEMSVLFPLSMLIIIILYWLLKKDAAALQHQLKLIFLPITIMVLLSFGLLKILNNQWLPHGAADYDLIPSFHNILINFWLYCAQGIANINYVPIHARDAFYEFVRLWCFWPLLLATILIVFYAIKKRQYLFLVFFIHIGIFLLPNLFRFGAAPSSYENVRFVYFALPFMLLCLLMLFQKNKLLLSIVFLGLFGFNFLLLNITKQDKMIAGKLHEIYKDGIVNFTSQDAYLLNIPSMCRQFFVYRSIRRVGIAANMKAASRDADDYKEVMWYYAVDVKDSFSAQKIDENKIAVRMHTPGVWLMREFFGAEPYENNEVKVELMEGGYTILFKTALPSHAQLLLYSMGQVRNVADVLK